MKKEMLSDRHIGIRESDIPDMLKRIGVKSLGELISRTIPSKIRLKDPLKLKAPMSESEFLSHINALAAKNRIFKTYIGTGW